MENTDEFHEKQDILYSEIPTLEDKLNAIKVIADK